MKTLQKRYQYFSKERKIWTEWFDFQGEQEPWQLKPSLRNEYRIIEKDSSNDSKTTNINGYQAGVKE